MYLGAKKVEDFFKLYIIINMIPKVTFSEYFFFRSKHFNIFYFFVLYVLIVVILSLKQLLYSILSLTLMLFSGSLDFHELLR